MKKRLSKLYNRFISFCLENRLGKTRFEAKTILFIMGILGRVTYYKNTYDGEARGHYVPQFILKKFRVSDDQSKLGFVYTFLIDNKSIVDEKIVDAAQEPDYYIFNDKQGNKSDYTEKQVYRNLEDSMSRVVRYFLDINKTENFTFLESSIIATFVAHQITRTPCFYENLQKFISFLITEKGLDFKKDLFINDYEFNSKAIQEIFINNSFKVTQEELNSYRKELLMTSKSVKPVIRILSQIIADGIGQDIHKKNIFVLDTTGTNHRLVISDNPVLLFENARGWWNFPAWWDMKNANLTIGLPITPYKAIILHPDLRKDGESFLSDEESQMIFSGMINTYQFGAAHSRVFGDNKNYLKEQSGYYREVIDQPFEFI